MTLTSPFAGNTFTPWPQPSYRVDGTGRLWLRGLFTAATAPSNLQHFWDYPDPLLAPTQSSPGTGRLFAVPLTHDTSLRGSICRIDAGVNCMSWQDGQSAPFGSSGLTAWTTLPLSANWSSPSGPTPSYAIDGESRVWLRGFLRNSVANVTSGDTVATLPAGARPSVQMDYGGTLNGVTTPNMATSIRIGTDGTIKVFFVAAAQKIDALPLGHISFDTTPLLTNYPIYYGSLDAISWDTAGGPSLATRPGFPLNVRLKDGKKPVAVLCWATNKDSGKVEIVTQPGWIAQGAGPTGNQLTITNVADLRDDQAYTLNFFIFF